MVLYYLRVEDMKNKKKEKTGWRALLLLTMSSNNKCWGAVDSLLPFAVKKPTPFYIGCAPEYKIWYNNNNKNNFFYNILNNALKKAEDVK